MVMFYTLAIISIFAFGYLCTIGREGYYMQSALITACYWGVTFYYTTGSKLMFLTLFFISLNLTIITLVTFFRKSRYNKRMVKKYDSLGKWNEGI